MAIWLQPVLSDNPEEQPCLVFAPRVLGGSVREGLFHLLLTAEVLRRLSDSSRVTQRPRTSAGLQSGPLPLNPGLFHQALLPLQVL